MPMGFYDSGTGSGSGKECLPECERYKREPFAQRPWKPIYELGVLRLPEWERNVVFI